MRGRQIGDIAVHRVVESEQPLFLMHHMIPDALPERLDPYRDWLEPDALEPGTGRMVLTMQSYLIRTPRHNILIDTCVGNDKERAYVEQWNQCANNRYLDELAAHGLTPDDIDIVMCTHLHPDHVGWNTRLIDGRWVPTFANARYVFARKEWEFWAEKNKKKPNFSDGAIDDSVLPVIEAGQAVLVETDHAIDDQAWLEPAPGHTPGHIAVRLSSNGADAVMWGDTLISPVQCAEPGWNVASCFDAELSRRTRREMLERHCETDTLVLTAHFPSPSVGHVLREQDAFRFRYAPDPA